MAKYKRILCIPDLQAPYHHKKAIEFLANVKLDIKPDFVVCLGDELDQYTLSRYTASPDAPSAGAEYDKAMDLWRQVYNLFPRAIGVTSNHVERVAKRAAESGIPRAYLKDVTEFMRAPEGWKWANFWDIDGIRFEHGERAGGGPNGLRNLVLANICNTAIGHHHESPGTIWVSNGKKVLWGLNAGCLVDEHSHGLTYTKNNKHKPVLGCGVIIDGTPRFIPY